MKQRVLKIARWVAYPLFYVFALMACFYITFPWDKVKDRVVAEFDKSQQSKGDKAWRLEIGTLSGYWLTGVEITGAKITIPASEDDKQKAGSPFAPSATGGSNPALMAAMRAAPDSGGDAKSPKDSKDAKDAKDAKQGPRDSIMLIEKVHARVRLLPLLIGRIRLDFTAQAFGGEVHGTVPVGGGTLNIQVDHVDLSQVTPLRDLVTVPLKGIASGKLEMSSEGGKWSKASGSLDLTVTDVAIGDGKAKLAGMATLPQAQLGTLEIAGKASEGLLKLDKFGATGKDVEIAGEGYLRVKEPWDSSSLDLIIRFGFSDAYRAKDDKTKSLLGDPADKVFPALIDQNPKMKQAKRDDGMYGFRGRGMLKSLKWDPTQDDAPAAPNGAAAKDTDASSTTKKKPPAPVVKKKDSGSTPTREPSQPEMKGPPSSPDQGGLPTEVAPPPAPPNAIQFNPNGLPIVPQPETPPATPPQPEQPPPPPQEQPPPQPAEPAPQPAPQ